MLVITTLLSVVVAVVMTFVAWRLVREEQHRSNARVSALAADIYSDDGGEDEPTPVAVNDLFAPDARPRTQGSLANALAIGALVVGSLIALVVVFSRDPTTHPDRAVASVGDRQDAATADAARLPLELTALGQDRQNDELNVRGMVRNPAGGASIGPLVAGVSAFNREGELVATARAPIESGSLEGGVESKFLVRLSGVGDVYRYRVSFTVDNRTVAHVDRRDHNVTAQLP
jgi:hypothetical protein